MLRKLAVMAMAIVGASWLIIVYVLGVLDLFGVI